LTCCGDVNREGASILSGGGQQMGSGKKKKKKVGQKHGTDWKGRERVEEREWPNGVYVK